MKETEYLDNVILPKLLPVLEQWCITYKVIGYPNETPRYSQLMRENEEDYANSKIVLKSTQKNLYYPLDLTDEDQELLKYMDSEELWNWWKSKRTEYLLANHPTINAY